jgi:hypothetical protein
VEKSLKRRNRELREQTDHLNGLASRLGRRNIFFVTTVACRGEIFYLEVRRSGQPLSLASFADPRELAKVLIHLSCGAQMPPDQWLKAKRELWDAQLAFSQKRRELVADAHKLNYPAAALQQQCIMEDAWDMRGKEILCARARDWVDLYEVLPEHVGIRDFDQHNPDRKNLADPVPCADCDWLSGEFRSHAVPYFPVVYQRCASWPEQNYMVELRCLRTENIKNTWQQLIADQIYPLMDRIKKEGFNKAPGRELICEVKKRIAPWTIPRPWPDEANEKKRLKRVQVRQHIQRLPALVSNTQNDQTATF